ncbi:hypothetical protein KIN20_020027 [Parelaphostrongylus tenuis]|uniref:Uncharacterized protein n=1 Tax=Parelaphostrongylus tenuis TaxID=148309 RepID=A0AAD5QQJ4_PARTN|nr:hypothetical protein KIN20_020027 [Parelaphostrongylus tenuis]
MVWALIVPAFSPSRHYVLLNLGTPLTLGPRSYTPGKTVRGQLPNTGSQRDSHSVPCLSRWGESWAGRLLGTLM